MATSFRAMGMKAETLCQLKWSNFRPRFYDCGFDRRQGIFGDPLHVDGRIIAYLQCQFLLAF